jgi:hypothetical protein
VSPHAGSHAGGALEPSTWSKITFSGHGSRISATLWRSIAANATASGFQ